MPDHIHLLITPTCISVERAVQFIKGGFSHRARAISGNLEIWQVGFSDRRVRSLGEYNALREYIRSNPVKARLCAYSGDFPYSSVRYQSCLDALPAALKGEGEAALRRG
jgi:putative transposase